MEPDFFVANNIFAFFYSPEDFSFFPEKMEILLTGITPLGDS